MGAMILTKPVIKVDQMVRASEAAKRFGEIRRKAKEEPQFITEKGKVDTVLLDYDEFEYMYELVSEIEMILDEIVLADRLDKLEAAPEKAVSWRDIRRS